MTAGLGALRARGVLGPLDVHLAHALSRLSGETRDEVALAVALASLATRQGSVCLDLRAAAGRPLRDAEGGIVEEAEPPPLGAWRDALRSSPLIGGGEGATPLVLDGADRLYLRRYWEHEQHLAVRLRARAVPAGDIEGGVLGPALRRLFGPPPAEPDAQRLAAQVAVVRRLAVVSGGPGTGKTTTVVKILALLSEHHLASRGKTPRMLLLAPTGKAAARLVESVQKVRASLACEEAVRAAIPETASTIHRALGHRTVGPRPGGASRRAAPLLADVVVVDESSMVDVSLMRRLLDALPPEARLLLLGDKDQLASVEAGAVLGDICGDRSTPRYSPELDRHLHQAFGEGLPAPCVDAGAAPGLGDCIVHLTRSHRFDRASGIGRLAARIQAGDAEAVLAELDAGIEGIALVEPPSAAGTAELRRAAIAGFRPFVNTRTPREALRALEGFRILCAHRKGPAGVEQLNLEVEQALAEAGLLHPSGPFYARRPILVTRNDYELDLFNGDTGVLWPAASGVAACFSAPGSALRTLGPARLPPHETVFAMSIHKSQGSELDTVSIVLPDASSPLLSRELLYTAVTRARRAVTIYGGRESVAQAVRTRARRATGLGDALWGR